MCGRYSLARVGDLGRKYRGFTFQEFDETRLPRYNIAPTQPVLAVRNIGSEEKVEALRWGIERRAPHGINVRAETLERQQEIRNRCVIFADGFYEWRDRRPHYYTLENEEPFLFAGVWLRSNDHFECAIITTEPNELVAQVHDRMPVILDEANIASWLAIEPMPSEIAHWMLRPYPADRMRVRPVSRRLNNARYDAPDVLVDDEPEQQLLGF